jgi:hypothetical protein
MKTRKRKKTLTTVQFEPVFEQLKKNKKMAIIYLLTDDVQKRPKTGSYFEKSRFFDI